MIPRLNLGGDSIFTLHTVHPRPRHNYKETTSATSAVGALAPKAIKKKFIVRTYEKSLPHQ